MAATARYDYALDRGLAHQARFTFTAVHPMLQLEESFLAVSIYVVGDG